MKKNIFLLLGMSLFNKDLLANNLETSVNTNIVYLSIDKSETTKKQKFLGANLNYEITKNLFQKTDLIVGGGIDFYLNTGNIYYINAGAAFYTSKWLTVKGLLSYNLKNDADYDEGADIGPGYELILSSPLYKADDNRQISIFTGIKHMILKNGLNRTMDKISFGLNAVF